MQPQACNCKLTWKLLERLVSMDIQVPLLVGGDFNEVLALVEISSGNDRCRVAMRGFNDVLNHCSL